MGDTAIRKGVIDQLEALYPGYYSQREFFVQDPRFLFAPLHFVLDIDVVLPFFFFPFFYVENVALVGTHQHSGVGGYLQNLLPQITSLGFVKQNYEAIVNGTVKAVSQGCHRPHSSSSSHLSN